MLVMGMLAVETSGLGVLGVRGVDKGGSPDGGLRW